MPRWDKLPTRGEELSCGHESLLPAAVIFGTETYCPTCFAWVDRKPENVKADA